MFLQHLRLIYASLISGLPAVHLMLDRPPPNGHPELPDENRGHGDNTMNIDNLQDARDQAALWKSEVEIANAKCNDIKRQLRQLKHESDYLKEKLSRQKEDNRMLKNDLNNYRAALEDMGRERNNCQNSLDVLRNQHSRTRALLETRTLELQDAQQYLTTTSSLSDSDVLRLIEGLNSQIFQTAARIADSVHFDCSLRVQDSAAEDANARVGRLIGPKMIETLKSFQHRDDPVCIQIALQASLVTFSRWIIAAWDFGYYDELMGSIYMKITKNESQSVSGRWRSITHRSLRSLLLETHVAARLQKYLAEVIADVLLLSGFHEASNQLHDTITDKYGEQIKIIVKGGLDIHRAIAEDIISCDFEPMNILWGQPFDAEKMDDEYSSGESPEGPCSSCTAVLCTTQLGLRRIERCVGAANTAQESQVTNLLKPKVALEAVIGELLMNTKTLRA
ncbi:hypothetical protein AcW1_003560 [Taiwanofungus camphoratus]|nr:hypothetical protein AcW1_003560 [Antrodia cinnamomea]